VKTNPFQSMKKKRKQETAAAEEAAQQEGESAESSQETGDSEEQAPPEPPKELTPEERIAELEGLLQRSRADFANMRRRALSDSDAAMGRAENAMLREMLTLADWLEMALASEVTSPDAITLKEGVRLTRDQLTGLLTNLGVKEIATTGSFNPEQHQAVATVDDETQEPGAIAEVIRKGFLRRTDVLRHAQVKVVAEPVTEEEPTPEPEAMDTDMESDATESDDAGTDDTGPDATVSA